MYLLVMNIVMVVLAFVMPGGLLLFFALRAKRKRMKKEEVKSKSKVLDIKTLKRMQRIYLAEKYRKAKEERNNHE